METITNTALGFDEMLQSLIDTETGRILDEVRFDGGEYLFKLDISRRATPKITFCRVDPIV